MSFFNVFKALLEDFDDPKFLQYMEQSLLENDKSIQELRKEEDRLRIENTHLTMEHYTLSCLFNQISYRKRYQEEIEMQLDGLLEETLKLGNILEQVEWKNLLNYNELKNAHHKQKYEGLQKEMKMLFQQMESRPAAIEFRQEQRKKAKLENMLKDVNKAIVNERKMWRSKIGSALQKRNEVILDLVIGSKNLKELRLKVVESKQKQAVFNQNQCANLLNSVLRSSPSKDTSQCDKQTMNLEMQTEKSKKPITSLPDIHFNVYDLKKFCFEKYQFQHKSFNDSNEKFQISNLRSIEEDKPTYKQKPQKASSKSDTDAKIPTIEESEPNNGHQNLCGTLETFDGDHLDNEGDKSSLTYKEATNEVMEGDILSQDEQEISNDKTISIEPIKKQKISKKDTPMLKLDTEKDIPIAFENDGFLLDSSGAQQYTSSCGSMIKGKITKQDLTTHSFLGPNMSGSNVVNETSPSKSDISKDFNPGDKEPQMSYGDMFSTESEVSEDVQNEGQMRVDFF